MKGNLMEKDYVHVHYIDCVFKFEMECNWKQGT